MFTTVNWITGLLATLTFAIVFVKAKTVEVTISVEYQFFPDVAQAKPGDTLTFSWTNVSPMSSQYSYVALADPETTSTICVTPKADAERIIPQCGGRTTGLCNYKYDVILDNSILDDSGSAVYISMWIGDCASSVLHIYTNGTTNGHGYSSNNDNSGSGFNGGIDPIGTRGDGSNIMKIIIGVSVAFAITVAITITCTVRFLRKKAAQQMMMAPPSRPPPSRPPPPPEISMALQTHWDTQMFVSNPPPYSAEGTMPKPTSPNPSEPYLYDHNVGNPELHYELHYKQYKNVVIT